MPNLKTLTAVRVDMDLLRRQTSALSEIQQYLLHGDASPTAEDWPEAIEGILNLLAGLQRREG